MRSWSAFGGSVCSGLAVALAIATALPSRGDTEPLHRLAPDVLSFVHALPLAPERTASAAAAIALVSTVAPEGGPSTPHPATRQIAADAMTSPLSVLHQYGHHVFYQLLPANVQPLYWHPGRCDDLRALLPPRDALQPGPGAAAWGDPVNGGEETIAEDAFSEAATGLFVVCFAQYQTARGVAVDPDVLSLQSMALAPIQPGMPAPPAVSILTTLCSLYAQLLRSDPGLAYADFIQSVLAHRSRSAGLPMPARTASQWLLSRALYGGMPGVALGAMPAFAEADTVPRIVSYRPSMPLDATVNGTASPARAIRLRTGDRLRTGATLGLLELAAPTTALLGSDVRCELRGPAELFVEQGQLFADGPCVINTPVCVCTTGVGGTAISVNMVGETTIGIVSGAASVTPKGAAALALSAGQTLTVLADGSLLGPSRADPLQVAYLLPLGGAEIAVGPVGGAELPPVEPGVRPPSTGAGSDQPSAQTPPATADMARSDLWRIHTPDLLPEAVLCTNVDTENNPRGVSTVFPPDAPGVSLLLSLDLGAKERHVKVRWTHGDKTLSGRIIRANGKRRILNSLRCGSGMTFPTGEYQVEVTIDDRPAATLIFFIQG